MVKFRTHEHVPILPKFGIQMTIIINNYIIQMYM